MIVYAINTHRTSFVGEQDKAPTGDLVYVIAAVKRDVQARRLSNMDPTAYFIYPLGKEPRNG